MALQPLLAITGGGLQAQEFDHAITGNDVTQVQQARESLLAASGRTNDPNHVRLLGV